MHAFDELPSILKQFPATFHKPDHFVAYACAMASELAYYHVPEWETDDKWKRAKRVPCLGYLRNRQLKISTSLQGIRTLGENIQIDAFETQTVIAIKIRIYGMTFIAFRGTAIAYDWMLNTRFKIESSLHSGFCSETRRICGLLADADWPPNQPVLLCGHSLGGAIAATATLLLPKRFNCVPQSTYIFGAPRFGNRMSTSSLERADGSVFHIRRKGDQIPNIPPRVIGYADYPFEMDPYLRVAFEGQTRWDQDISNWYKFGKEKAQSHFMESYRSEVGLYAKAVYKDEALVPHAKITSKNLNSTDQ